MYNKLSIAYLILIITPLLFGCGGPAKEKNTNSATAGSVSLGHVAGEKYIIDTKETVLTWEGSMVFDFDEEHIGYVYTSKGELIIDKGQLVGGTAEIDMNTIEYGDKENKNTPVHHLKSPDYFDVEKFPVSTFSITKVAYAAPGNIKVTGNLTIKGITNPVSFPANIEVKDGIVKATGKVVIDRTQWGIRYRSGKFYDNLADQAVSDDIEIHMKIVAKQDKNSLAQASLPEAKIAKEMEAGTIYQSSSPHHNVLHHFTYLVCVRDFCSKTLLQMHANSEVNKKRSEEMESELLNAKAELTSSKYNGLKIESGLYEIFLKQINDRFLQLPLPGRINKC